MFWIFWKHYLQNGSIHYADTPRMNAMHSSSIKQRNTNSIGSVLGNGVLCLLNIDLNCLFLSGNWKEVSGFSAEGDVGDNFKSRIAPDHIQKIKHYLSCAEIDSAPIRFQIKYEDGQWHWCELQLKHITASAIKTQAEYHCLLLDVTELVIAQTHLNKVKLEAEIATKSRSEFLANMSHELRTPLNAILGFAQMIEKGTYGEIGHPKYHNYITNIQESGATLLSRINDLLEIAAIDSDQMVLNEAPFDIRSIIREAIEHHSHRAFSSEVTLKYAWTNEPLSLVVDRVRMLQVITNIISNAIKYNRPGGKVDIAVRMRKDGGVNVIIQDNGDGIAESQLENILAAFRQDNSFFARSRECMGLGLALSKEIVKMHQGRIDIESVSQKGTIVTIRLPKERTVKASKMHKDDSLLALAAN